MCLSQKFNISAMIPAELNHILVYQWFPEKYLDILNYKGQIAHDMFKWSLNINMWSYISGKDQSVRYSLWW